MNYKNLYIYHHLGLGDHFICNAIIREYSGKYARVVLPTKKRNCMTVAAMYNDLKNVFLEPVANDKEAVNKERRYAQSGYEILRLGESLVDINWPIFLRKIRRKILKSRYHWQDRFYLDAKMNPEDQYTKFYLPRNLQREHQLFEKLGIADNEAFIFIHDDSIRGYNMKLINPALRIIRATPNLTENALDFLGIIEKAVEVHCIDSSFLCLIDHIGIRKDNLYYHINVRPSVRHPKIYLSWIMVE